MKKLKELPKFKNEQEETDFWDSHDVTDYIDMAHAKRGIFPNLKPSSTAGMNSRGIRPPTTLFSNLNVSVASAGSGEIFPTTFAN